MKLREGMFYAVYRAAIDLVASKTYLSMVRLPRTAIV